jgi:hypothetical protein
LSCKQIRSIQPTKEFFSSKIEALSTWFPERGGRVLVACKAECTEDNEWKNVWALAAVWVGLALIATLLAIWLKISTALTEIVVGTVA